MDTTQHPGITFARCIVNLLVRQVHATLLPDWSFKATGDGAERFCDKLLLKWRHRAIKLTVSPPRLGVPAAPGSGRLVGDSYTALIGRASMVTPELA